MPKEGTATAKDVPQEVEVNIVVGPGIIIVQPDTFYVSKGRKDWVKWTITPDMDFDIEFENKGPFVGKHFNKANPTSGPVRPDVQDGPTIHKYTVSTATARLDPTGVITK